MVVVGVPPVVGFLVAAHYFAPAQEECATAMGADGLGGGVGRCFDGGAFRRQCDFHCRRLSEKNAGLIQWKYFMVIAEILYMNLLLLSVMVVI